MTAAQLNTAIDREIWKMRDNTEAIREQEAETEAERQFRSLRGCWADDLEDADRMEAAIREAREQDVVREIALDD